MENQSQIHQGLARAGIVAVFAFGSKIHQRDGVLSDTDIGILLNHPPSADQTLQKTIELEDIIAKILPRYSQNLQITILNSAPISLQYTILREGKLIQATSIEDLANFREAVMQKSGDLLPFLRLFNKERLSAHYATSAHQ